MLKYDTQSENGKNNHSNRNGELNQEMKAMKPRGPTNAQICKIRTINKVLPNHYQNGAKLSDYYDTVKSPNISPITVNKFIFFPIKFIRFNFLNNPNFK